MEFWHWAILVLLLSVLLVGVHLLHARCRALAIKVESLSADMEYRQKGHWEVVGRLSDTDKKIDKLAKELGYRWQHPQPVVVDTNPNWVKE